MEPITTGIPGFDRVLRGGLQPHSLHVVGGLPGTGKTSLAQQVSYNHAKSGGRVLYLAALSETADRLVEHAAGFSFFDADLVASSVYYVSAYHWLEEGGLPQVMEEIRRLSVEHRASLVVLDGLSTFKTSAKGPLDFQRFVYDMSAQLRTLGATGLLLGPWAERESAEPEFAVADGIAVLSLESKPWGAARYLEVLKLRGADYVPGRHSFTISHDGLMVEPRMEAVMALDQPLEPSGVRTRIPFGAPGLDQMLGGGLPSGSVTLVAGASGVGKTVLGLGFIAEGSRAGAGGVLYSTREPSSQLAARAKSLGMKLDDVIKGGLVRLHWSPPLGFSPDRMGWELLRLVDESRAARVVIDDMEWTMADPEAGERWRTFLVALMAALRGRGVTTLVIREAETPSLSGLGPMASFADNVLFMSHGPGDTTKKKISVLKMRDSGYEGSPREVIIGDGGIRLVTNDTLPAAGQEGMA